MNHIIIKRPDTLLSMGIIFLMLAGINACTISKEPITVLNSGNNSFAALQIDNPHGDAVSISAGENTGAIGYALNGEVYWLKGQPKVYKTDDSSFVYTWNNDGREVVLQLKNQQKKKSLPFIWNQLQKNLHNGS